MKSPIPSTCSVAVAFAAGLIAFGSLAQKADAAVTVNFQEVGGDVVATYSGTLDLSGLEAGPAGLDPFLNLGLPGIDADEFRFGIGNSSTTDLWSGISGPISIGSSGAPFVQADTSSGDFIGILNDGSSNFLFVPGGFSSGSLTGSSTWNSTTLSALGITPGSYQWDLPSDSLTITATEIPEPSVAMFMGIGALALIRRRKRDE